MEELKDYKHAAEDFKVDCPCPKKKCEQYGHCNECRAYHDAKGKLP
jgi:hypothetical protein